MRPPLSVLPLVALLAGGLSAVACSDNREPLGPEPGQRPAFIEAPELQFLTWGPGGPPLQSLEASVRARPGESSRLTISYGRHYKDTEEFLRLDIDDESLLHRPDGTLFPKDDWVEIRAVVDRVSVAWTFSPPRLVFKPGNPAELRIRYVGAATSQATPGVGLQLWRQEVPGQPWVRVRSVQVVGLEIRTRVDLGGFTRFALAIGR